MTQAHHCRRNMDLRDDTLILLYLFTLYPLMYQTLVAITNREVENL
jgi:hypothetical protein